MNALQTLCLLYMLILLFLTICAVNELRLAVFDLLRILIYPMSYICNKIYLVFSKIKYRKNLEVNTIFPEKKKYS